MQLLSDSLKNNGKIKDLVKLAQARVETLVLGVSDSQKRHLSWLIAQEAGLKCIYVAWNEMQARQAYTDFSSLSGDRTLLLSNREIMLYDVEARSYEQTYHRITALLRVLHQDYDIIVTSAEAILHHLMPPGQFLNYVIKLETGKTHSSDDIEMKLLEMGYEREEKVEGKGQYAKRGGIIDIFPVNSDLPYRIEFFDIEIDSIRLFSPESQRSVGNANDVVIYPAREIIYSREEIPAITERIRQALNESLPMLPSDTQALLSKNIKRYMDKLNDSHYFTGVDKFIPYLLEEKANLFDYIQSNHLVVFEDPERSHERMANELTEISSLCETLLEKGMVLKGTFSLLKEPEEVIQTASRFSLLTLGAFSETKSITGNQAIRISIEGGSISSYSGKLEQLADDLTRWVEDGYRALILVSNEDRVKRFIGELDEKGIRAVPATSDVNQFSVAVGVGYLQTGFIYKDEKLVIVAESDISAGKLKQQRKKPLEKGKRISSFAELKLGDFVVHQAHGIGVYQGINQLLVEGIRKDYLKIGYKDGGTLYIPTTNMDLIQKYIGSEGREPKLNKLGGAEWAKTKTRVKESLRELADSLIKLQAERHSQKGHAFMSDTVWQRQFEESFPYEETPDQLKCIEEIKKDMEADGIMDRLLCGDVGYGKTEVALRAVFKAVMDGKQAAFLVPTTVLCSQHFENFKKRFSGFPMRVEMLSRFKTEAEQKAIIKDIKAGRVDVVVGTHMLFADNVAFKDLGLLIIDEEHRFGVEHKESLKLKYPKVDLLTLSATPIPRTLNMALTGIRDISTLEDPPEHRYPVQTYVVEYRDDLIRDAIHRELARGGQVFYLFNRVQGIHTKVSQIQKLIPEARVAYAHGQMGERELERVIQSFLDKDFDIMVCTTIIESGIDMPNVNTIMVEDSDRLGLAQLYQLRGRVGRSNRLAYAYLTYKRDKVLNEIAEKRLKAIREFTEFGSGFKIAMRDMQIRGAGNLLGPEQHGHMETVGYDMYLRLLSETVSELQGQTDMPRSTETTVELQVSAYIDSKYIADENQRIDMYRIIATLETDEEGMDIRDELIDRYGGIPEETEYLIDAAVIKNMAAGLGFASVKEKEDAVLLNFSDANSMKLDKIGELMNKWRGKLLFSAGRQPYLSLRTKGDKRREIHMNIKILLQNLQKLKS